MKFTPGNPYRRQPGHQLGFRRGDDPNRWTASRPDGKVARLVALFGDAARLATALGCHKSTVSRWRDRVPPIWTQRVLVAADARGVARERVLPLLEPAVCRCCGQELHG